MSSVFSDLSVIVHKGKQMGEIIVIHVGQGGIQIGLKFWETLLAEHGLDFSGQVEENTPEQANYRNVFFKSSQPNWFTPRAVFVDLEPGSIDTVKIKPAGRSIKPDNLVAGQLSAGHNWAKGYYTEGAEIIAEALDRIDKEVAACNNLQGFILMHSIGGGTGGGMGSLILEKLRETYPNKIIATGTIFPSKKVSDETSGPYNVVLSINKLMQHADLVFCLDNEAIFNIATKQFRTNYPTYSQLNPIIGGALSHITAPLRSSAQGTQGITTLKEMVKQLVPKDESTESSTPRSSLARFINVSLSFKTTSSQAVTFDSDLFTSGMLTDSDPRYSKLIAAMGIIRGKNTHAIAQSFVTESANAQAAWLNTPVALEIPLAPKETPLTIALLSNSTGVRYMLKRIHQQFTSLFSRYSFVHWYTHVGLDTAEFEVAEANLKALIDHYQAIQGDTPEEDTPEVLAAEVTENQYEDEDE